MWCKAVEALLSPSSCPVTLRDAREWMMFNLLNPWVEEDIETMSQRSGQALTRYLPVSVSYTGIKCESPCLA